MIRKTLTILSLVGLALNGCEVMDDNSNECVQDVDPAIRNCNPVTKCGLEFLPDGELVDIDQQANLLLFFSSNQYGIDVIRDSERLADFLVYIGVEDSDVPELFQDIDFDTQELIVYRTKSLYSATFCFNGLVDLVDGRRAVIAGLDELEIIGDAPPVQFRDLGVVFAPSSTRAAVLVIVTGSTSTTEFLEYSDSIGF